MDRTPMGSLADRTLDELNRIGGDAVLDPKLTGTDAEKVVTTLRAGKAFALAAKSASPSSDWANSMPGNWGDRIEILRHRIYVLEQIHGLQVTEA